MLFDSHAHINDERYKDDRHEMIMRAYEGGVRWILVPGASLESSVSGVALTREYEFVYASVGVHPHEAGTMDDMTLEMIKDLARDPKVRAIGEIGLDFHYDFSPREIQRIWFKRQIQLARSLDLPVIIHDREAHREVFDMLVAHKAFDHGVIMHCFSASKELALEYVNKGAYISLAGPVTFKNAKKAKEVALAVPLDRLLIETDSPYLTPEPFRGRRNEPDYVRFVAMTIAGIKGMTFDELGEATAENARKAFGIR
ncbi:MAG: hydrolase TatD [delta proteobacterium ML8_F1]|nr:MAG: hydrolase TatD [delta proteobacterium ML8_F1]